MKDWKEQTVSEWELINRLAVHRFGDRPLAEEAALAVMDGLLADDGRRIRQYKGTASFQAFLAAVSRRLLEDFARKRFGRKQPPLWIRNLGGIWRKLYHLLCLERLDLVEAVAVAEQSHIKESGIIIEEAAWKIRQEVIDCGSHQGLEVSDTDAKEVEEIAAEKGGFPQQEQLEEKERKDVFRLIFTVLTEVEESTLESQLALLTSVRIKLQPEEKLLLKLCFQENIQVSRAGKMLGWNRNQTHGRLRRLLNRIREAFNTAGLAEEIIELLK